MAWVYHEHYTIEDYQQWQGDWELLGGMPYAMTPSPSVTHQMVSGNVYVQLKTQLDSHPSHCASCYALIETDWEVSSDTVVRPDCMIICHEPGEKIVKTPELIVEVVSSTSAKRDETLKFDLYQKEGVLYYLLVYPEKKLAKAFSNHLAQFSKIGDFSTEQRAFNFGACSIEIDFSKLWR